MVHHLTSFIVYNNTGQRVSRHIVTCALSLLIAVTCLCMTDALFAQATFTPLGRFGGTRSAAHDISADGSVVVGTFFQGGDTGTYRLFRWTAEGSISGPSSHDSAAASANGAVVVSTTSIPLPQNEVAIRWTAGGATDSLGTLPGDLGSAALDTSADGTVVVGRSGGFAGFPEAFRWTEAGGMIGLGGLPGDQVFSVANGVSADGAVIVGGVRRPSIDSNASAAFRWTVQTGMVPLEPPSRSPNAAANAVSADGSIIVGGMGIIVQPTGETQGLAFRWTQASGMVSLGDLPGGRVASRAHDVSANGSVIVGTGETFYEDGVGLTTEAFYWTADTGMLNLREALISAGATGLEGWTLTEARGVSYDGLTVVGTGVHNGVQEAFVATIPEPSTLGLAASGAAAFLGFYLRARRRTPS